MSEPEILVVFNRLLTERKSYSRRTSDLALSSFTHAICYAIALQPKLLDSLTESVQMILDDCEVYYNMERERARDAIAELANLTAVYVYTDTTIYTRCCRLLTSLRASYPI